MFVLKDSLETKKRGKPVYFGGMTGIGPRYTENLDEAERFDSKRDAIQSPAYVHPLCFFEPAEA
ncbi:hypothetical protein [uncultured Stutzerimonas sp.]|uniref:hypothetical protein n=1 Tax=uncultured Stutzerimonas sp. TaxID=2901168 RepID=UPI0032B23525|tara:strand:+ start:112 stop:303 length:192 start_codon:yes stop_codon:yes gene_type:complete